MKKRFAVKILAILFVATMVCAGSAFAFNPDARNDSSRVTVGQNGYGDALLGQIYQSLNGYNTTIKVINTSDSLAVVARLSFRSALNSCHIFDIPLYLTPTDMFECEVRLNAAGHVEIYSEDDSVLSDENYDWNGTAPCNPFDGVWANEVPLQREFWAYGNTPAACWSSADTAEFGHFEILGLAAFPATAPLSKDTLAMAYGQITGVPAVDINRLIDCDFNLNGTAQDCPNVLTGKLIFDNTEYSNKAALNLIALKNWNDEVVTVDVAAEVRLDDSTYNTVPEIEATLAKTEYVIPFDFSTEGNDEVVVINTLPTRYEDYYFGLSAYPGLATALCQVDYLVYDMYETRILDFISGDWWVNCLMEVQMSPVRNIIQQAIDINPTYEKGWMKVVVSGVSATGTAADDDYTVTYTGVPIINSYLVIDENADSADDFSLTYATSPESDVFYTNTNTGEVVNVRQ